MFGIFTQLPEKKPAVKAQEPSIDRQIYVDVYSAQELLLKEAEAVLAEPEPYDKERRATLQQMRNLGFANAQDVKEFATSDNKRRKQEDIKRKVEYYQQEYPLNKFIDEDTVKKVCEKYKLLLTGVSDYISDIPEKNQKEIVSFRVKVSDIREPYETYRSGLLSTMINRMQNNHPLESPDSKITGRHLLIVAPEHKLDTRGKEKVGHVLKIKDPIVLQPVSMGYLIVSSWGLEAGDELIVNSINN